MPQWLEQQSNKLSDWAFSCCYLSTEEPSFNLSSLGITAWQELSGRLDQLMLKTSKVFKNDLTTSVVQLDLDTGSYIAKRYNARNIKHHFSRAVRMSRAQRCWNMSFEFARIGLNVAAPIMMYEQRFGPLRLDAYFISQRLSGSELLSAFPGMPEAEKKQVVMQVSDAFSKMRKAKITHGDMKATNLMWVDGHLYFIDLDASKQHRTMLSFERSNKKDKKRFLKNWQDKPELLALFSELA